MESLAFVAMLNESPICFIPDLSHHDWQMPGSGFEVYSPSGEIRAFYTWAEANTWRLEQIRYWFKAL